MKKPMTFSVNLADIPFSRALEIAYAMSGKTYEKIAEEMSCGTETIRRYFTDPNYNPPSYKIPKLCRILGNFVLIEWQVVQAGGSFNLNNEIFCIESLETQIAQLTKEFSEVLAEDGSARLDGEYCSNDLSRIEKEIDDLIKNAQRLKKLMTFKKESVK